MTGEVPSFRQPQPKVCRVVTIPWIFATWLRRQIRVVRDSGIDLTLVASPGAELDRLARDHAFRCHPVPIRRGISPTHDLVALLRLVRFFAGERFDIVHTSTPKAGLLGAVAAKLARVPIRIHTYTGQPWVVLHGALRQTVRFGDRVIATLDTRCYADSMSQREFLVREGVVADAKLAVLGDGSIGGVDLKRFDAEVWRTQQGTATRAALGISDRARVIVFVGRVTCDKGIVELVSAFESLDRGGAGIDLVLVGPMEPERDPVPRRVVARIAANPRIHLVGFTDQPEKYLGIADVFCLPSYREGFGTAVIEAAAMGVPAVVTSIIGLVDAVVAGETGLFVPPRDDRALASALSVMLADAKTARRFGEAARRRVVRLFDAERVDSLVVDEYRRLAEESQSAPEARLRRHS